MSSIGGTYHLDAVFFSEIGLPKSAKSMYNVFYTVIKERSPMKIIMMIVPVGIFVLSQSKIIETMASSGMKD